MSFALFDVLHSVRQEFNKDFPGFTYSIYSKEIIHECISKDVSVAIHIEPFPHESDIIVWIYYLDNESAYLIDSNFYDADHKGILVDTVDEIQEVVFNILRDIKAASL